MDEAINEAEKCIERAWSVTVHNALETTMNSKEVMISIGVNGMKYRHLDISINKAIDIDEWSTLTLEFYHEKVDSVRYSDSGSRMIKWSSKIDSYHTMSMTTDDRRKISGLLLKLEDNLGMKMPDEVWDYL